MSLNYGAWKTRLFWIVAGSQSGLKVVYGDLWLHSANRGPPKFPQKDSLGLCIIPPGQASIWGNQGGEGPGSPKARVGGSLVPPPSSTPPAHKQRFF